MSQDLRDEINPCSMPQGASRAVRVLILRGLAFRDYKTHCRAKDWRRSHFHTAWVIRGGLAGAILAAATSLAVTGAVQTNQPLVGALIFPVGLILIVLLGLDLVTGSFGLLPLPWIESDTDAKTIVSNWGLLAIALTNFGATAPAGVAAKIVAIAEAKTTGYEALGYAGLITVFVKAILCNWMVCLAIVAAMTTSSTIGKIACAYMPVFIFFAQGFEHSVVNMFMIPTGMMMGAKVTISEWWLWNQIPVTLGNLIGGGIFTGIALYLTHKPRAAAPAPLAAATRVPAE